jgi:phospholipid/cholesterol/gamma-HCH transport system substrate-binding protein
MTDKKTEVFVGITVTVAILILVLGLIWGKGMKLFSSRGEYIAQFKNVKGLGKGDPVVVRGVDQGQIDRIVLKSDCAEVYFWIAKEIAVFTDATIVIENQEIMGGKQLSINPGRNNQRVLPGFVFQGEARGDLDALMTKSDKIFSSLDTVLTGLKEFLDPVQFKGVIWNLEMSAKQLHAILTENRQNIHASIERMDAFTEHIEKDSTAIRFNQVVRKLDRTATLMNSVLAQVETQEGTFGKLVNDQKLYNQLVQMSSDLDSLIIDIQRSPKRYFHVSVF